MIGARAGSGGARTGNDLGRRPLWLILPAIVLLGMGCVSIRLEKGLTPASYVGAGAVDVRVFETGYDLKNGTLAKRRVRTELCAVEESDCRPVHGSMTPSWGVADLAPGRYRVTLVRWTDDRGEDHAFASPPRVEFELEPGAAVGVAVVLRSGRKAAENVGVAAATVVAIVVCAFLDTNSIPCSL